MASKATVKAILCERPREKVVAPAIERADTVDEVRLRFAEHDYRHHHRIEREPKRQRHDQWRPSKIIS